MLLTYEKGTLITRFLRQALSGTDRTSPTPRPATRFTTALQQRHLELGGPYHSPVRIRFTILASNIPMSACRMETQSGRRQNLLDSYTGRGVAGARKLPAQISFVSAAFLQL